MYQRLQCEACCRVFDHRDELKADTTIWCPHCSARYIPPAERRHMAQLLQRHRESFSARTNVRPNEEASQGSPEPNLPQRTLPRAG